MRAFTWLALGVLVGTACSDERAAQQREPGCARPWSGAQSAGTIAVNFTVDDAHNQTYLATDGLAWRGAFAYDAATRCITRDPGWGGPYPLLYDDGPWTSGGHEPAGSTAGDHVFGATVFHDVTTSAQTFEYGVVRSWTPATSGEWIWVGPNGTFTIPAGSSQPIDAPGFVVPAFGTVDVRFLLDTSHLAPEFAAFNPVNGVQLKGSAWEWHQLPATRDGTYGDVSGADSVSTFQLGARIGADPLRHVGLVHSGDQPEFVWVLGGVEYKVGGVPQTAGVAVQVRAQGAGTWTTVSVANRPTGDRNTYVTVP